MKKLSMLLLTIITCILLAGCGSSELAEKTGMNESQEKAAIQVFNNNGITELEDIQQSKQKDNMYYINTKNNGYIFFELNTDKSIKNIVYETQAIYADGQAKNKIKDILVTNEERIDYTVTAQTAIEKLLLSPNNADFKPYPLVMRNKDIVVIMGEVTAPNAFGVELTGRYRVKLQLPDKKILEASVK